MILSNAFVISIGQISPLIVDWGNKIMPFSSTGIKSSITILRHAPFNCKIIIIILF